MPLSQPTIVGEESHRQATWKSHAGQIGSRLGSRRPRLNPSQLPFQCLPSSLFCLSFTLVSPVSISVLISLELSAFCLALPFTHCHFAFPPGKGIRRPSTTPQTQPAKAMAAQKRITKVCQLHISSTEPILTLFQELGELTASPPSGVTVGLTDEANLFEWNVTMDGPTSSPYAVSLPSQSIPLPRY